MKIACARVLRPDRTKADQVGLLNSQGVEKLFVAGAKPVAVARRFNVARSTVYRVAANTANAP